MRENHILIIDDDLMLLKTAEEILSDQYNVSVAKSGIQALNLLNKNIIPDGWIRNIRRNQKNLRM